MKNKSKSLFVSSIMMLSYLNLFPQIVNADEIQTTDIIPVMINEICAKNTTLVHEDGNYYDWIELYNNSDEDIDLSGYGLSEKEKKPFKYTIPDGTVINAREHLVFWCDKDKGAEDSSIASFSLSTDGETVILTSPNSVTVDKVTYSNINSDISYGRVPDGADMFSELVMSMGSENKEEDIIIQKPVFSAESGFYNDAFDLEILANEGMKIYYTTDGSDPDTNSILYEGAISIYDISGNENTISSIENITVSNYSAPGYPVDKAVVIKAAAFNENGNRSDIITNSYFIGYDNKSSYYKDMKVISIVTDSKNFFDDETGIYVTGNTYKNWLNSNKYDPSCASYNIPANYRNDGREWEREAVVQIFENQNLAISQNLGISIHGKATRVYSQKSFNLNARSQYGAGKLKFDLFSGNNISEYDESIIKKYDSFILRNGGNDAYKIRFRDKLIQELSSELSFSNQQMEPCIVFINGEYWGQYEITEKLSEYYLASHFGVDEENVGIIKNNNFECGDKSVYTDYKDFYSWISSPSVNFADDDTYNTLLEKIDIKNYIEYMCSNIYVNNLDWGSNNFALWKTVTIDPENPYADGKWRFIMFDTEHSSNYTDIDVNIFTYIRKKTNLLFTLYRKLMENENFKNEFYQTFMYVSNDIFNTDKVNAKIDDFVKQYKESTFDVYDRFYYGKYDNESRYSTMEANLRNFYNERFDYVTEHFKEDLGIEAQTFEVRLFNDNSYGQIKFNSYTPNMNEENMWTGKYFSEYPVSLSVIPEEGHTFLYYLLSTGEKIYEPCTNIKLDANTTIRVVYDEDIILETTIWNQPEQVIIYEGENAVFYVEAEGENLKYRWYWKKDEESEWKKSSGEGNKANTLTIPALMSRNGYYYMCRIIDEYGTYTYTDAALLTVIEKLEIEEQPSSAYAVLNDIAQFSVNVKGEGITYQWQWKKNIDDNWHNSTNYTEGYNESTLKVIANNIRNGYSYRCVITDIIGNSITTDEVTLNIYTPVDITEHTTISQPYTKEEVVLSVNATGTELKYQWYWRQNESSEWKASTFNGCDTNTMTFLAEPKRNGYQYKCIVTDINENTVETDIIPLEIIDAVKILENPKSVEVEKKDYAVFSVNIENDEDVTYQWQWKKHGSPWTNCTEITEGYNSSSIKVLAERFRNNHRYRCLIIKNSYTIKSATATLTVIK